MAADLQVSVDGNALDNDSWRYIVDDTGDDIGLDGQRALVVDFIIQANDQETLDSRYKSTRDDFIKLNPRVVFSHLDTSGGLVTGSFADVSPNDGIHTDTSCTIAIVSHSMQTGYRYRCRFFCVAGVQLPSAGGASGSGDPGYSGLISKTTRARLSNRGGVASRQVLLTFGTTYNSTANGPYTISSVEDDGNGYARFVLATAPPTFDSGMRLEVSGTTNYNGVHAITAIDVGNKKVTTDIAYGATETGTAYVGDITTGEEHFTANKSSIFTDLLGTASDGTRDSTTGLKLTRQSYEDSDTDGKQFTVLLQSAVDDDVEITSVNDADRGFTCLIEESEVDEWDKNAGTAPRMLRVTGSLVLDKTQLSGGSLVLHQVFNSTVLAQIKTHVLTQTGYAAAKLRSKRFGSSLSEGTLTFVLTYQVRNLKVISYKSKDHAVTEDDTVSWRAGQYNYDQRPEGLQPKTIIRTVTRVGWNRLNPNVSPVVVPSGDAAGATYRPGAFTYDEDQPANTPDGLIYAQTWSQVFVRRRYEGGAQGVQIV